MTDEEMRLAAEAKQLLESNAFRAAMAAIRAKYRDDFEDSKPEEKELRDHCYCMVQVSKDLHRQLTELANKGRLGSVRQTRGGDRSAS